MNEETGLGSPAEFFAALDHLAQTIDARADGDPAESYTAKLLAKGPQKCAKKLGEEAVELALALVSESDEAVASEAGDLLYHLLVALRSRGLSLDAVGGALATRQAMSGLEEKASRTAD
ncbi:MAG: phosphoribosyl-ATP diphosphatase [Hyphomonadaceae bacterium]|nr:phosphoribosyl-ATP diphosphatase [Hyphomonadaceae bacterium]